MERLIHRLHHHLQLLIPLIVMMTPDLLVDCPADVGGALKHGDVCMECPQPGAEAPRLSETREDRYAGANRHWLRHSARSDDRPDF